METSTTTPNHSSKDSFGGIGTQDFDAVSIKLASPDAIRSWSYGEVTKAETINYRTGKSERNGLFDERIFGPERDYQCYCGKYSKIRYKGIICEKCGVEVTKAIVRRERMGHIELASPVTHIWFLRGIPSRLAILLDIPANELERVVYFASYVVTAVHEKERAGILKRLDSEYRAKTKQASDAKERDNVKELFREAKEGLNRLARGVVLDEAEYHRFSLKYGTAFEANIGAEALYKMCVELNLEKLEAEIEDGISKARAGVRQKLKKRLGLVRALIQSETRPEWMFVTVIPVIPPALRPMVALQGGRHATSDINDLYRRVINRNVRLKKLQEIEAPDVILRNEKRILQEAADALFDNTKRHQSQVAVSPAQRRALKSLADSLSGKQGYFRQNLLGKRVDYSGRSVIVVGSELALDQCGLPKHMALELFRPFVLAGLLQRELAYNIRGAGRLIEEEIPEVWAILEEVTKDKYVLLNRAPTLHRLGVQAFRPVLIEGNAIQIHPLVCTAFNADFDGDMMAVHVPLSERAQKEARELMAANTNLLSPGSGAPIVNPSQDIVLGCFWMTKLVEGEKGEGKMFATPNEAITAYDFGQVGFRAHIKVLATESKKYAEYKGGVFETTVGRLLFNSVLPSDFAFQNSEVRKKDLSNIIEALIDQYGMERTPEMLDKIKAFGFRYATKSGITWGMGDIVVPKKKKELVEAGQKQDDEISAQWKEGLLSSEERYRKIIGVWQKVHSDIEKLIPETLDKDGSVYDMVTSGARGSIGQVTQTSGMKGLIPSPTGRLIDFPIVPSYKEGLSPIEYFVTTHGSRKGLADTALKTAESGYLTRRLVYVADNAVIREATCGAREGRRLVRDGKRGGFEAGISKDAHGHFLVADAKDKNGKIVLERGTLIGRAEAEALEEADVEEVSVRTPLSCKSLQGVCQKCYGYDMARGELVGLGEPVGIVAAQAIGEPGTQLTMRTFHQAGVAGADITTGLPRVAEVFERRTPKSKAVIATGDGVVTAIERKQNEKIIKILTDKSTSAKSKKDAEVSYAVPFARMPLVEKGAEVKKGAMLTDGSADLTELYKHAGRIATEEYIIHEILKVYELQGVDIARKHIEVIVRQMFSRRRIKEGGDTRFAVGDVVGEAEFVEENARVKEERAEEARGEHAILGITEVSLTTDSFLSAASFQRASRVLIDAAIRGKRDDLSGLKENVIVGRLIPAGTGFDPEPEEEEEEE